MKDLNQFYSEATSMLPKRVGKVMLISYAWRGKRYMIKMFFPQIKLPSRKDIQTELSKVYPGSKVYSYDVDEYSSGDPLIYIDKR